MSGWVCVLKNDSVQLKPGIHSQSRKLPRPVALPSTSVRVAAVGDVEAWILLLTCLPRSLFPKFRTALGNIFEIFPCQ